LARISTSRKDESDWSGIAASLSRRCSRQGEWMSWTGTAKMSRQGSPPTQRPTCASHPTRRRPTTWSQWSIAFKRGSISSDVHNPRDVVTRARGALAPSSPSRRAAPAPPSPTATTTLSTPRPRSASSRSSDRATSSAAVRSSRARTITRTAAPGSRSRRKWASKGSSNSSSVDIPTPVGCVKRTESVTAMQMGAFHAPDEGRVKTPASARRPRDRRPGAVVRRDRAGRRRRPGRRSGRSRGPRWSSRPRAPRRPRSTRRA
jgi:hypothetical protein